MIITIDCRWVDSSGIGVYIKGCLPYFLDSENHFFLIGDPEKLSLMTSGHKNAEIIDCRIKPFSFEELLFFPFVFPRRFLKKINSGDFYYSPYFNIPAGIKVPVYTTIHDLVFPDMPELASKAGLAARMWFYRRAYKKSKKIFTVSEFSKSRIAHHLGTAKPVIVTHSAIQERFLAYRTVHKIQEKKKIIVFIGNIKKHKGLDYLLDVFLSAKKDGLPHKLVIIGGKENFRSADNTILKKIESAGEDTVSFTGFISDEQVMEYLAKASLLVQPSLYEGFCLPPLEAMVLGTRALISDIPVLREIYSSYPVTFFRAGDSDDLKEKLIDLLENKPSEVVSLSEQLLLKYTFQKTASTILANLN